MGEGGGERERVGPTYNFIFVKKKKIIIVTANSNITNSFLPYIYFTL